MSLTKAETQMLKALLKKQGQKPKAVKGKSNPRSRSIDENIADYIDWNQRILGQSVTITKAVNTSYTRKTDGVEVPTKTVTFSHGKKLEFFKGFKKRRV